MSRNTVSKTTFDYIAVKGTKGVLTKTDKINKSKTIIALNCVLKGLWE